MPKRVFFSFDFIDDLWRASVVRNRWVMDPTTSGPGFWAAEFTTGNPTPAALEAFVDEQVAAAQVTAVLIGARTASCAHVSHAIRRSAELGRGLVGIYVDQCKDRFGSTSSRGPNPFDLVTVDRDGTLVSLSELVPTYDWVNDDGFHNLATWIADGMARAAEFAATKPPR
jgi:hypothetical protein